MGDTAAPSYQGFAGALAPLRMAAGGPVDIYPVTLVPGSASADYATGGQPLTLPSDVKGKEFCGAIVLNPFDGARAWQWNGSTSAPKLIAYDGFAAEEGATATVNGVTLYVWLCFKS